MYWVRGVNGAGDPVDLHIEVCWRCGIPVVTNLVSMDEHVDRAHPVTAARHALAEGRAAEPLPELWRDYPTEPAT